MSWFKVNDNTTWTGSMHSSTLDEGWLVVTFNEDNFIQSILPKTEYLSSYYVESYDYD